MEVRRLELLPPSVDIGHVNVNYGDLYNGKSIAQGITVIGPGTSIYDYGIDFFTVGSVNSLDQLSFMIRLESLHSASQLPCQLLEPVVYFVEGYCAIMSWIPFAEHVEVDPV